MSNNGLKYNRHDALQLVADMEKYEQSIMSATRTLYSDTVSFAGWKDAKYNDFCRELSAVIQDIKHGANTVHDYKEHLSKKIRNLG